MDLIELGDFTITPEEYNIMGEMADDSSAIHLAEQILSETSCGPPSKDPQEILAHANYIVGLAVSLAYKVVKDGSATQ